MTCQHDDMVQHFSWKFVCLSLEEIGWWKLEGGYAVDCLDDLVYAWKSADWWISDVR